MISHSGLFLLMCQEIRNKKLNDFSYPPLNPESLKTQGFALESVI